MKLPRLKNANTSKRRLSPRAKRSGLIVAIVLVLGLVVFAEVIRPNQDAKAYTDRLTTASAPLEKCFDKLSATTALGVYYAPDISIEEKQQDVTAIRNQITTCRHQLADFDKTSHQLMSLHLAGYTKAYHDAKVNQRQAFDVIGQSTDVMNQYDDLASFLTQYYDHVGTFLKYNADLTTIDTGYITTTEQQTLASQSSDLRKRASALQKAKVPAGFEKTAQDTASMFTADADGIDNLLKGYRFGNDFTVSTAYQQIDKALQSYDSTVINQPFTMLISSYVPKQVNQLPGKVSNLLAAEVE